MAILRAPVEFDALEKELVAEWREIPTGVITDCLNRSGGMRSRIRPLQPGMAMAGQARTVACMVGDNSAAHAALKLVRTGKILVIDSGGGADVAVWGGIMTAAALHRGVSGVVVDGAVRDVAEIRESGLPCFAAGIVPLGPHKGWGGSIDVAISCGGCVVRPGDLIVGDDDGVAVVPLERHETILAAAKDRLKNEARLIDGIAAGESSADLLKIDESDIIGG